MEILEIKKLKKNLPRFECLLCDFKCYMKNDWKRHLLTDKHVSNANGNNLEIKNLKNLKKLTSDKKYSNICCCGKEYSSNSGLWKHQKKCNLLCSQINDEGVEYDKNNHNLDISNLTTLICELVKTNTDIHKSVLELCKNESSINTIANNNINSHNKTFNLQVFLNETCKDAMNISDFVESVQLQVSDLENVGKVGYIEGISNIIIKNLNALEMEKRPIHCADQKREVLYVKDENIWEKEDEENQRLRKAIRKIAHKNICMLKAFREKYPDCEKYNSKKGDQYDKIVIEAMGGHGDNDYEKNSKIIKKIAKVVGIDKKMI